MRHNSHYVEDIISRSGAAIGRMIPIEQIQPNADQPRKELGDLQSLTDSVRDKGVLEPLLVRYLADSDKFMIISGERRYHAALRRRSARTALHRKRRGRRRDDGNRPHREPATQGLDAF